MAVDGIKNNRTKTRKMRELRLATTNFHRSRWHETVKREGGDGMGMGYGSMKRYVIWSFIVYLKSCIPKSLA